MTNDIHKGILQTNTFTEVLKKILSLFDLSQKWNVDICCYPPWGAPIDPFFIMQRENKRNGDGWEEKKGEEINEKLLN